MKVLFGSDIHGSIFYGKKLIDAYEREKADTLVLLGDLLYHGPRNDLPFEYNPKELIKLLNEYSHKILAVRGNCEAEVDQMVLDFPVLADYAVLDFDNNRFYATHGHLYSYDNLPKMGGCNIFIQGHTHILMAEKKDSIYLLNPGSVSIPKGGNPNTYGIYENNKFTIKKLDGEVVKEISFN